MSSPRILRIAKQTGSFTLDEMKCYEDVKDGCAELFQQFQKDETIPQPMFRCVDGKLQIFEQYEDEDGHWGEATNIWGYCPKYFLKALSKHIECKSKNWKITFSVAPEYNAPEIYEVTKNKVTQTI